MYNPLAKERDETGLQEVDNYVSCRHNTVKHFISTQTHNGTLSGGIEASRVTGGQSVVVTGRLGLGGDADGGLGGGTGGGGGGYGRDRDGDGQIIRWEDTVENIILQTEPNEPLAYALVLEPHHLIIIMLGGHIGQLDRDRECIIMYTIKEDNFTWTYIFNCLIGL